MNHPTVTSDGRVLSFPDRNPAKRQLTPVFTTFSQTPRFKQYEVLARRTGIKVGPGAYRQQVRETKDVTRF